MNNLDVIPTFGKVYNCSIRVHDSNFLVRTINMILTQAILQFKNQYLCYYAVQIQISFPSV